MFPLLVFPSNISLWLSLQDFSILALEVGSIEVHEFLAAYRFPVFFLYCRKSFLYCHINSPKFASIPLLWFFHYGKTVGSTAAIIVSDGFLPQQGMHRSASTQRSLQFVEEISVITKLPNSEQSYKGKVKTHNYINRQNQSTTGKLWKP